MEEIIDNLWEGNARTEKINKEGRYLLLFAFFLSEAIGFNY